MILEYQILRTLLERYPRFFRLKPIAHLQTKKGVEALLQFELFDEQRNMSGKPVLGLFAGVHGIEAIGVKILQYFIDHVLEQTSWNTQVVDLLGRVKVVGIPIVNPVGFVAGSRCNGNGVDLMRNAPVESSESVPFIGGHRLSPLLPYFRGNNGFEAENLQVLRLVESELWASDFSFALDIHSGFGAEDYLWTPYAKQKGYPPLWSHFEKFRATLDRTLKNHVYVFEPQSNQYCTSGDLWDYLFDLSMSQTHAKGRLFLPMTLEVGSWIWLKKSPSKAFEIRNFFNPVHPHRERRVLRRHLPLLNLLLNLVADSSKVLGFERKAG